MKYKLVLLFVFTAFLAYGGSWEKKSLSYFSELKISGNVRVQLIHSEESYLEIYDYCCSMQEVKVTQDGKLLKINYDKGLISDNEFDIIIYYSNLTKIQTQVGARIESKEWINSEQMEISVSTGAELNLGRNSRYIDLQATTGAIVYIDGEVDDIKVVANTGASVELNRLNAVSVDAKALTGAVVKTQVIERIRANAGTGGFIEYQGDPEFVKVNTHLGGEVHCMRRSKEQMH